MELILDCETAPLDNAAEYLETPEPDKRLTDPAKIRASIEEKKAAQLDKCGLDWNVARIVCVGYQNGGTAGAFIAKNEVEETAVLRRVWDFWANYTFVGFRLRTFDLPLLIQRSRYLGVPYPRIGLARFGPVKFRDLYDELTFNDTQDTFAMRRTLTSFCKRFGLNVPADDSTGADIAGLVREGRWDEVAAHCLADVAKTRALADRLGVIEEVCF